MKKLLVLLLTLSLMLALASCDAVLGLFGHECAFDALDSTTATCFEGGVSTYKCKCGKTEDREVDALGHNMQSLGGGAPATCTESGTDYVKCTRCGKFENTVLLALGHEIGTPTEASRFGYCTREGCTMAEPKFPTGGKYEDVLTFTFGDAEKEALAAKHDEMLALLEAADDYDAALHGYAESGDLYDRYVAAETVYEEYTDLIYAAMDQYSIAMTLYYCNQSDASYEAAYEDMSSFYTDLVSKYYTLSQPWYDSMYREFFFYGATEEEINAFLFDSNALSNPEYTALKDRNNQIELEYFNIADPITSPMVTSLYAEMVENNNRLAEILGYDNYLEYAYSNVYSRDYTYQDVATFTEYVKDYIIPIYNATYKRFVGMMSSGQFFTDKEIDEYYAMVMESFFENQLSNEMFNNYIDDMNMAFSSNPDKAYSFSDALNALCADGNLFRGEYEGAYVTYLYNNQIPIAYFGEGYDAPFTIAHEFGHYMNEIYNESDFDQSYDLLETHSQGHEMLFIFYAKDHLTANGHLLAETYEMVSVLSAVVSALRVDAFEQAIYLNSYSGPNADVIMADGKITADEYDLLYTSIGEDFGVDEEYDDPTYWRYGMTITSPCYYVSYSVSAINALQLYAKCYTDGFDAAKESYLKLITYTDTLGEDENMTLDEVLEYAGLLSYIDEQTYINIANHFNKE